MPFLKNTWYTFAHSHEVTSEQFLDRIIAEEEILVYRKTDGSLAAIKNRCPHRFVPLSKGKQIGDVIQCGYHGLEFGGDGKCTKNPIAGVPIPRAACVKSYPVVERDTLVWVWLGEAEQADDTLIPDYSFLIDKNRRNVGGYLHTNAHYELSSDNLLDLTHVQFVHNSLQASEAFERAEVKTEQDGETINTFLTLPNGRPSVVFQNFLDPETRLDLTFRMRWDVPGCMRLTVTGNPPGETEGLMFETSSAHIVSPETEATSHYFYINSRTTDLDNPDADEAIRAWQEQGFTQEDKPMLEAQQKFLNGRDLLALKPAMLRADAGNLRARQILAARIAAEQKTLLETA